MDYKLKDEVFIYLEGVRYSVTIVGVETYTKEGGLRYVFKLPDEVAPKAETDGLWIFIYSPNPTEFRKKLKINPKTHVSSIQTYRSWTGYPHEDLKFDVKYEKDSFLALWSSNYQGVIELDDVGGELNKIRKEIYGK